MSSINVLQLTSDIPVYIIGDFDMDLNMVNRGLSIVRKKIDKWLGKYYLKGIVIGEDTGTVFKALAWRDLDAMYADGSIFVLASKITSAEDLAKSVVHEFAHIILRNVPDVIKILSTEYVTKRNILFNKLKELNYDISDYSIITKKYNPELDQFLLNQVGYNNIDRMLSGYVLDSYALNSIEEYFANSMEHYLFGKKDEIKELNPAFIKAIRYI